MNIPGSLAAAYTEQAPVTDWPSRLLLTGLTLVVIAGLLLLLRRSWRRRAGRQGGFGRLSDPVPFEADAALRCKYAGTARGQDLWRRVVAGGGPAWGEVQFGTIPGPSLSESQSGRAPGDVPALRIIREGSSGPVTIPYDDIHEVRIGSGMLQKGYAGHGLILLTWDALPGTVTTGLWLPDRADFDSCRSRLAEWLADTEEVVR